MNLIYYWMAVDRIIDGGIAFQMLVGEGGFCWVSNSNIDIELHKPTPTDPYTSMTKLFDSSSIYQKLNNFIVPSFSSKT